MLEGRIGGTVVLVKKDVLSLGHFQASLLDSIHHILGQDTGLAFQLVSATKADHREVAWRPGARGGARVHARHPDGAGGQPGYAHPFPALPSVRKSGHLSGECNAGNMFDKMCLHASKPWWLCPRRWTCVENEKDLRREFLAHVIFSK